MNRRERKEVAEIINEVLGCLPDSKHEDNQTWAWGWDELNEEAQSMVKAARRRGTAFIQKLFGSRDGKPLPFERSRRG